MKGVKKMKKYPQNYIFEKEEEEEDEEEEENKQ